PPLLTLSSRSLFFFSNPPATTEIYTLSLHDALPIFYKIADIGFQMIADFRNRRRQQVGIAGRELDLDILARWRPGIGLAGFNDKDRKSTRLNSSHVKISYAVFCLKKKKNKRAKQRRT